MDERMGGHIAALEEGHAVYLFRTYNVCGVQSASQGLERQAGRSRVAATSFISAAHEVHPINKKIE